MLFTKMNQIIDEISAEIAERDHRDITRETAPLKRAEDAIIVDTSDMTIEEVFVFEEEEL